MSTKVNSWTALSVFAVIACGPQAPVARAPRRLNAETANATTLEVDRSLLRVQSTSDRAETLRWTTPDPAAPTRRVAEVPIRQAISYQIELEFSGGVDSLKATVADFFGNPSPETLSPAGDSERRRFTHILSQATRDTLRLELNAPPEVTLLRFSMRETTHWGRSLLLNQRDRDLRAVLTRVVDPSLYQTRTLDSLLAAGSSTYEWPVDARHGALEGAVTWVPRPNEPTGAALNVSVEVRRAGRWESGFRTTLSGSDLARGWIPVRVELSGSDTLRLVTSPIAGRGTGTIAWGAPTLLPAGRGNLPDIVLVSIDACRSDVLGAYGSPLGISRNIDVVSRLGVVFEQARAQRTQTWTSLTSLMAGSLSESAGVLRRGDNSFRGYPFLADRLRDVGYHTVRLGHIIMPFGHFGAFDAEEESPGDLRAVRRVVANLRAHRDRPVFIWVHLALTHFPYNPHPPFRPTDIPLDDPLSTTAGFYEAVQGLDAARCDRLMRLYYATVRETDAALDLLFSEIFDPQRPGGPGVVALVADHGSHAGDDGRWFVHSTASRRVVQVPMILAAPGRLPPNTRVSRLVRLMDLAPTLIELVGGSSEGMEGTSLRALIDGRPDAPRVSITRLPESEIDVVETDTYRLRVNLDGGSIAWPDLPALRLQYPVFGLYRWREDPDERHNLTGLEPLIVGEMYRLLTAPRAIIGRSVSGSARRLLEQAGYAEGHDD
jgi:choline-sulfatase